MAEFARSFLRKRALPEIVGLADRPRRRAPVPGEPQRAVRHHRTIFISDVHLGTRGCKAETLVDFLNRNQCQTLYLVGDIVDGWRLKYRWFWPAAHSAVVQAILRKVDTGTRVIYVPGNHDEVFRTYCGREVAGMRHAHAAQERGKRRHEHDGGRHLHRRAPERHPGFRAGWLSPHVHVAVGVDEAGQSCSCDARFRRRGKGLCRLRGEERDREMIRR